jgi:hypothetical protein
LTSPLVARARPVLVGGPVPALVAGLRLDEEGLVPAGDVVGGDGRERTAGSERVGGFGDAHARVDPVERGRGQHKVERLAGERPVLERRRDHLDRREAGEVPAGDGGQVLSELDRHDPATAFGQRHRRLPRPGTDLQHPDARPHPRQLGQVVEQRRRIARSSAVVQLGRLVERRPSPITFGRAHDETISRPASAPHAARAVRAAPELARRPRKPLEPDTHGRSGMGARCGSERGVRT